MLHALTIDLEEWYHPYNIQTSSLHFERSTQAEAATLPILTLLERYGVKATFFVVGELAQSHPHLIERILAAGHELGCHGWTHLPLWNLTPTQFAEELTQFLAWRDATFPGVPILGYRASTFSLDDSTAWAVTTLLDHGFHYDSSIFPAATPLYGVPTAPLTPFQLLNLDGRLMMPSPATSPTLNRPALLEIPMSVFPIAGRRVGFTGGLYLRALPWQVVRQLFHYTENAKRPAVVYIHPWETYRQTPRLPLSRWGRFVVYYGMPSFDKLEKLLQTFSFGPMQTVFLEN
jgi:polysaccharide deacetylase family protein (PEP-CTERM system associated)